MNNINEIIKIYVLNKQVTDEPKHSKLEEELKSVSAQIACNDMWFAMEDDSDLMESCIYQRESLKARYRYLLKKVKESNTYFSAF